MLEYDVYAHVDGVDYQLCGRPIPIRMNASCPLTGFLLLECKDRLLVSTRDYEITYDDTPRAAQLVVHVPLCKCRVVYQCDEFPEGFMRLPEFDVVTKVAIHRDEDIVHAALSRVLRQNIELRDRVDLTILMYQKMCEMLVEVDERTKTSSKKRARD